jgi:hypothetical protein
MICGVIMQCGKILMINSILQLFLFFLSIYKKSVDMSIPVGIRNFVRKTLEENILCNPGSNISQERDHYVQKKLLEFNEEFLELATRNNHPFISIYLQNALFELKRDIMNGQRQLGSLEELHF